MGDDQLRGRPPRAMPVDREERERSKDRAILGIGATLMGASIVAGQASFSPQLTNEERARFSPEQAAELAQERQERTGDLSKKLYDAGEELAADRERQGERNRESRTAARAENSPARQSPPEPNRDRNREKPSLAPRQNRPRGRSR